MEEELKDKVSDKKDIAEEEEEELKLLKEPSAVNFDEIKVEEEKEVEEGAKTEDKNKKAKKIILKQYSNWELFKKSLKFSTLNWKSHAYSQVQSLVYNVSQFYLPYIHGQIIDSISTNKNYDSLIYNFQLYFTFLFIRYIITNAMDWVYSNYISNRYQDASLLMLENVINKDMEFFDHFKTGELSQRVGDSEFSLSSSIIFELLSILQTIIKLFTTLYLMMTFSVYLTTTYFIITGFTLITQHILDKRTNITYESDVEYQDQNANYLFEILANIRLIKAFSTEDKEIKKIKKVRNYQYPPRKYDLNFYLGQILGFVYEFNNIILLYAAGKKTITGEITYGDFNTFLRYTTNITSDIYRVKGLKRQFSSMFSQWQRFFEIYDYEPKIKSNEGTKIENIKGNIEFTDVTFNYPTKPEVKVLNNFSMKVEGGNVVAIVGSSGSGKSTISSLVQRFYDPKEGSVLLDEINLKDLDSSWLHNQIGFVSQEPVLFSGTIEENISYSVDSYTKEDLDRVTKLANAYNFIHDKDQFPEGYKTIVGERGVKVSGGQKQRIAIARALIKNAKILIFDEATSALDAESENEVQKAIDNVVKNGNITTIIIAHRLSTVKNANKIYVMNKGKIVEEGRHKELLKLNGYYKHLVQRQLEDNSLSRENSKLNQNTLMRENSKLNQNTLMRENSKVNQNTLMMENSRLHQP
jgi:ABC-type multidrug transport system fused ATPase/permease subunit